MNSRFAALWKRCAPAAPVGDAEEIFAQLKKNYAAAERHYHTLAHIEHCLQWFDRAREQMEQPDAVETALWFHDVIYQSRAKDNEQKSAEWFAAQAEGKSSAAFVARVKELIMHTVHCGQPDSGDADGCFIVDIDLSSIGLPWPEFHRDSCNVRREVAHLSDAIFAERQAGFLRALLQRDFLYCTEFFREKLETQARENIERHLSGLGYPEKMFVPH